MKQWYIVEIMEVGNLPDMMKCKMKMNIRKFSKDRKLTRGVNMKYWPGEKI